MNCESCSVLSPHSASSNSPLLWRPAGLGGGRNPNFMVLSPWTSPGSHSEEVRKLPSRFWQLKEENHLWSTPSASPLQGLLSRERHCQSLTPLRGRACARLQPLQSSISPNREEKRKRKNPYKSHDPGMQNQEKLIFNHKIIECFHSQQFSSIIMAYYS